MLLKAYRELRGLSRPQAALQLNTSRVTVYRWEQGLSAPGPYFIRRVAEWSDGAVTADDMLRPFNERNTPAAVLERAKGAA